MAIKGLTVEEQKDLVTRPTPSKPAPPVDVKQDAKSAPAPPGIGPTPSEPEPMTAAEFKAIDRQISADFQAQQASAMQDDRPRGAYVSTQEFEQKAAPGAETRGQTQTFTPSTMVDESLSRKLADEFGGKPSEYRSLTSTQLADKVGGKPTDYDETISSREIQADIAVSKPRNMWESITPWQEDKGQTFGKVVEDTFRETVTLGKAQTELYNKEEIAEGFKDLSRQQSSDWERLSTIGREQYLQEADAEYTKAQQEALASGQMLTMTREQYLAQAGTKYDQWLKQNKPAPGTLSVIGESGKTLTFKNQKEYNQWIQKQQPSTGELAKEFGLGLIPVYGTLRNWGSMGGVGRGASILGDLLFVVPVIGAVGGAAIKTGASVGRAGAIGSRIGNVATSSVRLTSTAASGIGSGLKGLITTPFNLIRSPIATTKAGGSAIQSFARGYAGAFKAGLKPQNIKAFGETLIGGKVYAPRVGGALVGGQSVKQIEGTRPMTQGDVVAVARTDISDVVSKTKIPPKETFSVAARGNMPRGQSLELTYPEKPSRLIVENPALLDKRVSPVLATQTRKLSEQELLGGIDIIDEGITGGGVATRTPTISPTTTISPQKISALPSVNIAPVIAVSPAAVAQRQIMPSISPAPLPTVPIPIIPGVSPTPAPVTTPVPVTTPSVQPSVAPSVKPAIKPVVSTATGASPAVTPSTTRIAEAATSPLPFTPIPINVGLRTRTPSVKPPPFIPFIPFSMGGNGGGRTGDRLPTLKSMVGRWETEGLFVGITDPETGETIVGGIKGKKRIKYGNIPKKVKSRFAGGGNVASAGGKLIKRVDVI